MATGRRRRVLVSCLAMAAFVPGVHGDQPQTFPSGVELITVDAVVTDAHGQPVTGLTREDFVLKEDGVAQEILGFQAFELEQRSGAAEARPAAPASNENAEKEAGRAFAVVVDDLGMKSSEAVTARGAISSFLEHSVGDGDLVSVGSASGEVWWSARIPEGREDLRAVVARIHGRGAVDSRSSDYMSDYEAHWIAEHGDSGLDPSQVAVAAGQGQEIGVNGILERVLSRWMEAGLCPEAGGRVMPSCLSNLRQNAQA
ncbi:MAG TPA: hypothetical protein VEQ10_19875, partial [Vicinamibacteria bacterium]|nr:hypothetical protein [Vicinamibacteria bacterium]